MNKVILIGRLTKDPEVSTTNSGIAYSRFTLAVNRKTSGEQDCDFINCIAWRNHAENICKYMKKGSKMAIVGNIQTRKYDDNGQTKYVTDVVVEETTFLMTANNEGKKPVQQDIQELDDAEKDVLPF